MLLALVCTREFRAIWAFSASWRRWKVTKPYLRERLIFLFLHTRREQVGPIWTDIIFNISSVTFGCKLYLLSHRLLPSIVLNLRVIFSFKCIFTFSLKHYLACIVEEQCAQKCKLIYTSNICVILNPHDFLYFNTKGKLSFQVSKCMVSPLTVMHSWKPVVCCHFDCPLKKK